MKDLKTISQEIRDIIDKKQNMNYFNIGYYLRFLEEIIPYNFKNIILLIKNYVKDSNWEKINKILNELLNNLKLKQRIQTNQETKEQTKK